MHNPIPRRCLHNGWLSTKANKHKEFAGAIGDLLNKQGACLEGLEKTIQDIEIEINRLDSES